MNSDPTDIRRDLPIEWVRAQFPALGHSGVLLDNAGGSAPLGRVADRVAHYMHRWPVQLGATYEESALASRKLAEARRDIAGMMGSASVPAPTEDEIVIGASASSLLSRLARSLAPSLGQGDDIIVTDVDHEANITPWRRLDHTGASVLVWPLNRDTGRLEIEDLRALLSERTRLVCFTHASNILGQAMPVAEVARLVRDCGGRTVVDGVAFAPHRALAVRDWDVDFYVFSLYKVFGPHCAVLYCRASEMAGLANINHRFMDDYQGPVKLEPGAFPYELLYGAQAVPEYLLELSGRTGWHSPAAGCAPAYAAIADHELGLSTRLLAFLESQSAVRVIGDPVPGPDRLPTISFVVQGRRSSEIPPLCDAQGIGIRWGHFYAPRLIQSLGLTERDGVVRVSMVQYNTLEEIDRLIAVLEPAIGGWGP